MSIEITRFVPLGDVDPIYFDRTYYLVPAGTEAQRRPYALLLAAMGEVGRRGARVVRARRQGEALPDPAKGDALALETLFVAEDVKSQAEIDEAVAATDVRKEELTLARQIISGLEGPFEPAELRSEYRASLQGAARGEARGT